MQAAQAIITSQPVPPRTDLTALVQQAQSGDQTAFSQLIDRHQQAIFKMIYFRTHSENEAEDLTQDVFLRACRQINKLRKPAMFKSWLFRIAVNRVRDHFRSRRIRQVLTLTADVDESSRAVADDRSTPEALARVIQKSFWQRIDHLLMQLSPGEREVFRLRFMDQLSIPEIARVLKKSESTVKTQLYRGVKKFKDDLVLRRWLKEQL